MAQRFGECDVPGRRSVHRAQSGGARPPAWLPQPRGRDVRMQSDDVTARAGAIDAPAVIPTTDGRWIVSTVEPGSGEPRKSVMFGSFPAPSRARITWSSRSSRSAGSPRRGSAHTRAWRPPPGSARHHWDVRRLPSARRRGGTVAGRFTGIPAEHAVLQRADGDSRANWPCSARGLTDTVLCTPTFESPT